MTRPLASLPIGLARLLARPLSDRWYLTLAHRLYYGCWPDYRRPRTLQEHVQAYLLRCRDPLLTMSADKLASRDFIAGRIGEHYLVPMIGVWSYAHAVPLDQLPRPCVLKPTHASGVIEVLRPGVALDEDRLRAQFRRWLTLDYSRLNREWYYRAIPRRIIAEHMLHDAAGDPPGDYKAYVIGGAVRYFEVNRGRFKHETRNLYRPHDWTLLPVVDDHLDHHAADPKPARLDEMIRIAEALAEPFEFLRVDFYVLDDRLYVGELTNTPGAGFWRFQPADFGRQLARYWRAHSADAAVSSPREGVDRVRHI